MSKPEEQISRESRIQAAIMGAFIGDALGLGPHWYYDLDELRETFGPWIKDYTAPKPGRYHEGLPAGASSQAGYILALTLRSLVEKNGYDQADFCRRLDEDLFPQIDGTPNAGPGGYTSQSIRDAYKKRREGKAWGEVAGPSDNTEGAERALAIALRYADQPAQLARYVGENVALTQFDPTVGAMTLAYCAILGELSRGTPFDGELSGLLMKRVQSGEFPFHAVTDEGLNHVPKGSEEPLKPGQFASPDALLTIASITQAATDPDIHIEPAHKAASLYGLPCAVYHQFPSVYYLAARFQCDFENAVLHAVNGGGQNQARAMLVGALCGAIGGMSSIPQRFLDGLKERETYLDLSARLAKQVVSAHTKEF